MLSGGEATLLASKVIDDPVLPIYCIDQQGRLALSVTAHSWPSDARRLDSMLHFLFVMGGPAAMFQRAVSRLSRRNAAFRITLR